MQDPTLALNGPKENHSITSVNASRSSGKNDSDKDFEKTLKNSQKRVNGQDSDSSAVDLGQSSALSMLQSFFWIRFENQNTSSTDSFKQRGADMSSGSNAYNQINKSHESGQDQSGENKQSGSNEKDAAEEKAASVKEALQNIMSQKTNSQNMPFGTVSFTEFIKNLEKFSQKSNIRMISDSIIEKTSLLKNGEKTEFSISLKPEWLGNISLKISSEDGKINVQIIASTQSKQLIDSELSDLELSFKNSNIQLGSISVSVGGQGGFGQNAQEQESAQKDFMTGILPLSNMPTIINKTFAQYKKDDIIQALGYIENNFINES